MNSYSYKDECEEFLIKGCKSNYKILGLFYGHLFKHFLIKSLAELEIYYGN